MELKRLTSFNPGNLLEAGHWTLEDPADFKAQTDGWDQKLTEAGAALEKEAAELADLQADHRRLNKLERETSDAARAKAAEIRSEGIRNPAADHVALGVMDASLKQTASFISGLVRQVVSVDIPQQSCRVLEAELKKAECATQVNMLEMAEVYGEFIHLSGLLTEVQGAVPMPATPKMIWARERTQKAWRAEQDLSAAVTQARTALIELEKATARLSL
jgi:hypothetical protein